MDQEALFIYTFLNKMYDGSEHQVDILCNVAVKLLENTWDIKTFIQEYNNCINQLYNSYLDFPYLEKSFVIIYCRVVLQ